MTITNEYLALFTKTSSVCDSIDGLIHLLHADSKLRFQGGRLSHEGADVCAFFHEHGVAADRDHRHFRLTFTFDGDVDDAAALSRFRLALRAIRSAIHHLAPLQLVWDELSAHYAIIGYPVIHELESLMRRLISSFMLMRVGSSWPNEALPRELAGALERNKREARASDYVNVLHELDFCQLGDFLFKPYSRHHTEALHKAVRGLKPQEDATVLQAFLPRSNWERYFHEVVTCDDTYLSTRWAKLYKLRCRIAHNTEFASDHLADLETLANEVRPHLTAAITKLSEVNVPPSEAEALAESVVRGVNETVGEFVMKWQVLESSLLRYSVGGDWKRIPTGSELHRRRVLTGIQANNYDEIRAVRNSVVHGVGATVERDALQRYSDRLESLIEALDAPTPVAELARLDDGDQTTWLEEQISLHGHVLLEAEAVSSRIAETNATGWTINEVVVEDFDLDLDEDQCVARFTFGADGEQDEDRMLFGTHINGSGEAVIGPADEIEFRQVSAEIDYDREEGDDDS